MMYAAFLLSLPIYLALSLSPDPLPLPSLPSFILVSPIDYDDVRVHGTNTPPKLNGTFDYDNVRVHGTKALTQLKGNTSLSLSSLSLSLSHSLTHSLLKWHERRLWLVASTPLLSV